MVPSFCPPLNIIFFNVRLSEATSLLSPTNPTLLISLFLPHTIFPSEPWSTTFPPTSITQPKHFLCLCLFLHPHRMSSQLQPAIYQSPHQAHLHTNLLPQFIHPLHFHTLHSCNFSEPVVLINLQPLLLTLSVPPYPDHKR